MEALACGTSGDHGSSSARLPTSVGPSLQTSSPETSGTSGPAPSGPSLTDLHSAEAPAEAAASANPVGVADAGAPGTAPPVAGAPGIVPPSASDSNGAAPADGAPCTASATLEPNGPSFEAPVESVEPSLDDMGNPVVFARRAMSLNKVIPGSSRNTPQRPSTLTALFSRQDLHHVDGTTEQLRHAASRIRHVSNPTQGPSFVGLAAKKAESFLFAQRANEDHHVSAAAHAVTMADDDEVGNGDLLTKAGRTMGHTMLHMGQLSVVYFCTVATNIFALVALYVLKTRPAANNERRQLWYLSKVLEFVPGANADADLLQDYFTASDHSDDAYDRSYFNVALLLMLFSLVIIVVASTASSGFHTLTTLQRIVLVLLTPFGLSTTFMSFLYATALKAADTRDDVAVATKRYDLVIMCQMLRATFETVPLFVVCAAALGVSEHPRVLAASIIMAAISLSYALYGYAVDVFPQKLAQHMHGRMQLFFCIATSTFWQFAALTCLLSASALGGIRWLSVPLLLGLGYVQLAPGVVSTSKKNHEGWDDVAKMGLMAASFAAVTPLAMLAAFIDGPLLGFASERTPVGSSAVSVIDRAVWWRRRVILFICGFATLILDLAGGVNSFQGIKILADLGDGIQTVEKDIFLLEDNLAHATAWWWSKAFLLSFLFIGDIVAASRAWRLVGFTPIDRTDLIMHIQSAAAWLLAKWRAWHSSGGPYARLAPELDGPPLEETVAGSQHVKGSDQARFTEEQLRLHDALDDLHRRARETYEKVRGIPWKNDEPPAEVGTSTGSESTPRVHIESAPKPEPPAKPGADADEDEFAIYYARMAAFETELAAYEATIALEQAEAAEKEAAKLASEAEKVAAKAAKAAQDFLVPKKPPGLPTSGMEPLRYDDLAPITADHARMAERVTVETANILGRLPSLSPAECSVAEAALAKYTPSEDDDVAEREAQQALLTMLRQLNIPSLQRRVLQEEVALRIAANGGEGLHPFRAVPLSVALTSNLLWAQGKQRWMDSTPMYDLSETCSSATHFISHSWGDDGGRKVALLREFLCLQPLLVSLFVATPIFCILFMPLGMAVHAACPGQGVPWWAFSTVPFLCLLLVLSWVAASEAAILPVWLTPWAVQRETIWLENACVDVGRVNAMMRAGFSSYIDRCDKMIAFVSRGYFERLWCVYELAYFCKKYTGPLRRHLDQDLLVVSVEWPSYLNVFQSIGPTLDELAPLRNFRCRKARCNRPTDRSLLLSAIRREWGTEDAFDTFVRSELPSLLFRQKQRYSKMLGVLTQTHLDIVFGG